jgi:hypothetical protein
MEIYFQLLTGLMIPAIGFAFYQLYVLNARMSGMEVKIEVFWKSAEKGLSELLISPHTPKLDAFLRQFADGNLPKEDLAQFAKLLEETVYPDNGKTVARAMLLGRIRQLLKKGRCAWNEP